MGLQTFDTIHDLNIRSFKIASPLDVSLFVKSCFEFDNGGDVFSFLGRPFQRSHDRAFCTGSIKRLLNCQNVGVVSRFIKQSNHRIETFVRVVQQDVLSRDGSE